MINADRFSERTSVTERGGSKKEVYSPSFAVERTDYKGRPVTLISLDYVNANKTGTSRERADLVPSDWRERIRQEISDASLVCMEYFPPEFERRDWDTPAGKIMAKTPDVKAIKNVYGQVAEVAKDESKEVAVADLMNKPLYVAWHFAPMVAAALSQSIPGAVYNAAIVFQWLAKKGVHGPTPTQTEQFLPYAENARRILTAEGIMQETERLKPGSEVVYIGSPQHTSRVSKFIDQGFTPAETLQGEVYEAGMIGLDRSMRIYKPTEGGWLLKSNIKTK